MKQSTKQKLEDLINDGRAEARTLAAIEDASASDSVNEIISILEQIIKEDEEPAKRNGSGGYYLSEGELQEIQKTETNK